MQSEITIRPSMFKCGNPQSSLHSSGKETYGTVFGFVTFPPSIEDNAQRLSGDEILPGFLRQK